MSSRSNHSPSTTPSPTNASTPADTPSTEAPTRPRIRIADRVGKSFPPNACVLGFGYFARQRVELTTMTSTTIEASVRGTRTHTVRLRVPPKGIALEATCTCAPRSLEMTACRHLWAVLLEVDRAGALERLRDAPTPLVLRALEAADLPASAELPAIVPIAEGRAQKAKRTRRTASVDDGKPRRRASAATTTPTPPNDTPTVAGRRPKAPKAGPKPAATGASKATREDGRPPRRAAAAPAGRPTTDAPSATRRKRERAASKHRS